MNGLTLSELPASTHSSTHSSTPYSHFTLTDTSTPFSISTLAIKPIQIEKVQQIRIELDPRCSSISGCESTDSRLSIN